MKTNHKKYLNRCLELAQTSISKGNHPFGALLVYQGKIIIESENEVNTLNDVTAHAELRLIQKAQKILTKSELKDSILYTSTEPCAMCSGAIYWAGVREIVYGCSSLQLFEVVKYGITISSEEIFSSSQDSYKLLDFSKDVMFKKIHQDFW